MEFLTFRYHSSYRQKHWKHWAFPFTLIGNRALTARMVYWNIFPQDFFFFLSHWLLRSEPAFNSMYSTLTIFLIFMSMYPQCVIVCIIYNPGKLNFCRPFNFFHYLDSTFYISSFWATIIDNEKCVVIILGNNLFIKNTKKLPVFSSVRKRVKNIWIKSLIFFLVSNYKS